MRTRELLGGAVLTVYFMVFCLGHLEFSEWLVRRRHSPLLGDFQWADFLLPMGLAAGVVLAAWQVHRAWRGCQRVTTICAWAGWLAVVGVTDRLLIYSLPEYLHYPQYALLAAAMAWLIDPTRTRFAFGPVLFAVTLLGIADETLQYTWITVSYSNYLDFNDFVLNLLGGFMGLLLYYGFRRLPPNAQPDRELRYGLNGFLSLGLALGLFIAAIHLGDDTRPLSPIERKAEYGTWVPGPHAGRYYVLPPVSGSLLLIALGAVATGTPLVLQQRGANPNPP